MADYIYLLENRLSTAQQHALGAIRNAARANDFTVFLTGGAVRDLTGGGSVRDLDVTVQGDASRLKQDLEAAGGSIVGEYAPALAIFVSFPGGVRAEVSSAVSVTYPKPGRPVYEAANISDDLRRRDFTANAMALSLNEGSYGLLMDPLNGTADIENRELRLVSNYGFIDEPSRLVRATRLIARLGWQMEERTRARYDTAKAEGYISALSPWSQGYETEEIFYEEDPLRVMRALESEGWLSILAPALGSSKVNTAALEELHERQGQLQTQAVVAPIGAIAFPLLTAKVAPKDVAAIKAAFARPGFAREIDGLEAETRNIQTRFTSREASTPSQVWKMLHSSEPALVLAMAYASKSGAVQSKLKTFLTESPSARQKIPYALLQEMRITSDLPIYPELLDKLFYELMDNHLQTVEEMKAFLSPYSPPAPPPPMNLRRARAKKEARPSRAKSKKAAALEAEEVTTVAGQEEQIAVASGLLKPGELAAAGQGTEPVVHATLPGKVAPLAKGTSEAAVEAGSARKPVEAKTPKAAAKVPEAAVAANTAPVLSAKPAPMPKKDAARLVPHPIAAKEIGASRKVLTLSPSETQKASKPLTVPGKPAKAAARPAAKAAKPVAGKQPAKASPPAQKHKPAPPAKSKSTAKKTAATTPASKKVAAAKKTVPARRPAPSKAPAKRPSSKAAAKPAAKTPAKTPAKKLPSKKAAPVKGKRR